MSDTITTTHDAGVSTITIARPAVRNALSREALTALVSAAAAAASDLSTRVIVLRGEGGAFCAGDDLDEAARSSVDEFAAQIDDFQRLARVLREARPPVIASIDGAAYGGGLEIAVNCDARIAADTARFGCPEIRWGLILSNASSVLLRRLVGDGWARELLLFGRQLDAHEALRIGLVTRVVAADELASATNEMAAWVLDAAPEAVALTKRLLNADDAEWLQRVLAAERDGLVEAFQSEQAKRRLQAFADRPRGR